MNFLGVWAEFGNTPALHLSHLSYRVSYIYSCYISSALTAGARGGSGHSVVGS